MADILQFTGDTLLDIEPNKVLEGALDLLAQGMVIGITTDGAIYLATSTGDIGKMLLLMERAKQLLLEQ